MIIITCVIVIQNVLGIVFNLSWS